MYITDFSECESCTEHSMKNDVKYFKLKEICLTGKPDRKTYASLIDLKLHFSKQIMRVITTLRPNLL